MSKSLQSKKNARSGHISIMTRTQHSIEEILAKNIAAISEDDIASLESARDICITHEEKIKAFDQEILDSLADEEDTNIMETECEKITENSMKISKVIKAISRKLKNVQENGPYS